jgi:FtsH-binding integral membrane protein
MKDPFMNMDEASKHIVDFASIVTVLGTLADMLPAIAAIFTIVWTAIRIYETKTVQRWLGKKDAVNK